MNYPGIDYSLGRSNFDPKTGIHFGVISTHSLTEWLDESIKYDYGDATCPDCGNPAVDACAAEIQSADCTADQSGEWTCPNCQTVFESDHAYSDEPLDWSIDDGEYKVIDCLDSDAMILKAPYYTYAQYCSPCVPGAGNLDNPVSDDDGGVKCYCFGHDWFDGDTAPYPVYSVATGALIPAELAA